jgi:hypothetical protein
MKIMNEENKVIIGVTNEKTGRIFIKNKEKFIEDFSDSFEISDIDSSLSINFKEEVFNSLQKDEWFYIDLSEEDKESLDNKIKEPRTLLNADEAKELTHILYYTLDGEFCNRANVEYLTKKSIGTLHLLISVSGNKYRYSEPNQDNLQITGIARIKYYKDQSKLYFKKHSDLKGFFDITLTYKAATQEEVDDFKEYAIVNFTKDFKVGDRNKQKIKMIIEQKEAYLTDSSKKEALKAYAEKYNLSIFNANDLLDVKSNKELTDIVDLLLENFNEDPISGNKVRIQSKKPL